MCGSRACIASRYCALRAFFESLIGYLSARMVTSLVIQVLTVACSLYCDAYKDKRDAGVILRAI